MSNFVYIRNCEKSFKVGNWIRRDEKYFNDKKYSKFVGLIGGYKAMIVDDLDHLSVNKLFKVPIETVNNVPIHYESTLTAHENNLLKIAVDKLLACNILQRSCSRWSSPVRPIYNKGKLEIEVDYSYLNSVTYDRNYPLPNVHTFVHSMEKSNLFSKIVVKQPFHQIAISEEAKCKTAFSTEFGSFEFNTLHNGLKNGHQYLQELMETVLHDIDPTSTKIFLGNVLLHTQTFDQHFQLLKKVFLAFGLANLMIDVEESSFLMHEETYLGYRINSSGISISQENLEKIRDLPIPLCSADVAVFLDLVGQFANFVPNFIELAEPLIRLRELTFNWCYIHQEAFDKLKKSLIFSSPIPFYNDIRPSFTPKFKHTLNSVSNKTLNTTFDTTLNSINRLGRSDNSFQNNRITPFIELDV